MRNSVIGLMRFMLSSNTYSASDGDGSATGLLLVTMQTLSPFVWLVRV